MKGKSEYRNGNLTKDELAQIERMAGLGLNQGQIASILGITKECFESRVVKDPELREAFRRGKANAIMTVAQSAFSQAVSGKVPAMTMFYLKTQAGWRETDRVEISRAKEYTTQELEQMIRDLGYIKDPAREIEQAREVKELPEATRKEKAT